MKLFLLLLYGVMLCACATPINSPNEEQLDSTSVQSAETISDSIKTKKLRQLTAALTSAGGLFEAKTYELGKFKRIKFDVMTICNLSSDIKPEPFVMIEITYGNDYYWYARRAIIMESEIPEFVNSITIIKNRYADITPDTETSVGFISVGEAKILAKFKNNKWKYEFYVNSSNDDTAVSFGKEEFDALIKMFNLAQSKIISIQSK